MLEFAKIQKKSQDWIIFNPRTLKFSNSQLLLCRIASKTTMAVVTETFNESAIPFMGIIRF